MRRSKPGFDLRIFFAFAPSILISPYSGWYRDQLEA